MSHQPGMPLGNEPNDIAYGQAPRSSSSEVFASSAIAGIKPNGTASSDDVEAVLTRWWQDMLGVETIGLDEDFFDLGGHSLIGVQLFSKIKQTYGVTLGLSTLFDARTIRQLAALVTQSTKPTRAEPEPWSPVVPIQANGSRPPLYIVPGGYGTTVLPFREVSLLLGADQPVYGFEAQMPPANEEQEAIPDRASRFVKELRAKQPNGPYCLLGWCGGGYVAFEMAQRLVAEGQKVAFLGIIECVDPQHPRNWAGGVRFKARRAIWRVRNFTKRGPKGIARWAGERTVAGFQAIGSTSRSATAKTLEKELLQSSSADTMVDARAWRNVYRYHPMSYAGKSVVVIGKDSWAYNGIERSLDPRLFWCKLSQGGSEVRVIPGDHMGMLKAPNSQILARELRLCIDEALKAN
ncbi:MAG: thioesterase domain-containing protein [Candidatus Acidiferrales bacterium]|jgi:thioesterase domain-containing protein/acyl carrier protein